MKIDEFVKRRAGNDTAMAGALYRAYDEYREFTGPRLQAAKDNLKTAYLKQFTDMMILSVLLAEKGDIEA